VYIGRRQAQVGGAYGWGVHTGGGAYGWGCIRVGVHTGGGRGVIRSLE
jgi:hypothetical protein